MFFRTRALCALLAVFFAAAAFSADPAPTFQLNLLKFLRYKDTLSVTVKTKGADQSDTQKIVVETNNELTWQEDGGFLLDVTVNKFAVDKGKSPDQELKGDPAVMIGMHYVLELDKDYNVKGYQEDNTPKKWLEKNLKDDEFKQLTGPDGQLANVDSDMQGMFVYIPVKTKLSGHPRAVGARWFDLSNSVVGAAGSVPAYSAWKVLKSEKVGEMDYLRLEQFENTSAKALAKAAKCKENEITAAGPLEKPTEGAPDITVESKTTLLIDPERLLAISEDSAAKLTIDMNPMLGDPGGKPDPALIIKLDMRILHEVEYMK